MKLEPKNSTLFGKLLISRLESAIVAPDPTKNATKLLLVQDVSPEAAAAGYKAGDLVVPKAIGVMHLRAGTRLAFYCEVKDVLTTVSDMSAEDFVDSDGRSDVESLDPDHASNRGHGASPS